MMRNLTHSRFWLISGLLAVDIAFFTLTDPQRVASAVLMVGFLLLAATIYVAIGYLLALSRVYGLSFGRHERRLALFATAVVGGLLALQSIGELTTRDALVLLPLGVVLYLYFSYGRAKLET